MIIVMTIKKVEADGEEGIQEEREGQEGESASSIEETVGYSLKCWTD